MINLAKRKILNIVSLIGNKTVTITDDDLVDLSSQPYHKFKQGLEKASQGQVSRLFLEEPTRWGPLTIASIIGFEPFEFTTEQLHELYKTNQYAIQQAVINRHDVPLSDAIAADLTFFNKKEIEDISLIISFLQRADFKGSPKVVRNLLGLRNDELTDTLLDNRYIEIEDIHLATVLEEYPPESRQWLKVFRRKEFVPTYEQVNSAFEHGGEPMRLVIANRFPDKLTLDHIQAGMRSPDAWLSAIFKGVQERKFDVSPHLTKPSFS